ncbi:MAG: glycosyltransferase family 39 protein [Nitrospirota bacterium]
MSTLSLTVLLAALIRLIFVMPLGTNDELSYAHTAMRIMNGTPWISPHHFALRTGIIVPASFFMWVFGVSKVALFLWPFLCSIASVVLIFFCANKYFRDENTALLASLLYAFVPLSVIVSTTLTPEPVLEFFSLVSFLFYLIAKENAGESGLVKRYGAFVLCGISIGFGYLAKEPMILILGVFGIFGLIDSWQAKRILWEYTLIVFGFAVIFAGEQIFYFVHTDIWFYRLTAVGSDVKTMLKHVELERNVSLPNQYIRHMFFAIHQTGLFFYVFVVSVVYLFLNHKMSLRLFAWFLVPYLYLQFGSGSLTEYLPLPKLAKYLSFMNPPVLLVISRFLFCLKKPVKGFIVIILLLSSLGSAAFCKEFYKNTTSTVAERIVPLIADQPAGKFYSDPRLKPALEFLLGVEGGDRFIPYAGLNYRTWEKKEISFHPQKGDWVIIGKEEYFRPHKGAALDYPFEVHNPPAHWALKETIELTPGLSMIFVAEAVSFIEKNHLLPTTFIEKIGGTMRRLTEKKSIVIYEVTQR